MDAGGGADAHAVRLFFAIDLPTHAKAALGHLKPQDERGDYRWADASTFHVTLAFLGDQPAERLQTLESVGRGAASNSQRGELRLGEPGTFGARRAPRVLWVDLTGDLEALLALQSRLAADLRREGFALEARPFAPHITLARRRESAGGGVPSGWPPIVEHAPVPMHELMLFESRLSPRGASYSPVFRFPISG